MSFPHTDPEAQLYREKAKELKIKKSFETAQKVTPERISRIIQKWRFHPHIHEHKLYLFNNPTENADTYDFEVQLRIQWGLPYRPYDTQSIEFSTGNADDEILELLEKSEDAMYATNEESRQKLQKFIAENPELQELSKQVELDFGQGSFISRCDEDGQDNWRKVIYINKSDTPNIQFYTEQLNGAPTWEEAYTGAKHHFAQYTKIAHLSSSDTDYQNALHDWNEFKSINGEIISSGSQGADEFSQFMKSYPNYTDSFHNETKLDDAISFAITNEQFRAIALIKKFQQALQQ